ncbi:MAG: nucleotidyl transferase AbiEii/AbiGii toxin family protein [Acidobacteriia bacterium]|nr:nucleotidyl transferase AbiEii/AbiGii toxin family protein [Terriglobia bacterium]
MVAHSRIRRGLRLTPHQELHERLMWEVIAQSRALDLVLKGGTALAFCRGLNRHSTDLDFDTDRPVDLRDHIDSASRAMGVNLEPSWRLDRPGRQVFRARYPGPSGSKPRFFKVNVRYKDPLRPEDIEFVDGVRTYKVPALFDQKLAATASRVEARDLFDLAFVMEHFGDGLQDDQIRRADTFTKDLDRLERRYKESFEEDEVLKSVSDAAESVLRLRFATTNQRDLRWPLVQEQGIPIPRDVIGRVFVIRSRARLKAGIGADLQDTKPGVDRDFLRSLWDSGRERTSARDMDRDPSISR